MCEWLRVRDHTDSALGFNLRTRGAGGISAGTTGLPDIQVR